MLSGQSENASVKYGMVTMKDKYSRAAQLKIGPRGQTKEYSDLKDLEELFKYEANQIPASLEEANKHRLASMIGYGGQLQVFAEFEAQKRN
jgi:hypothetical protein